MSKFEKWANATKLVAGIIVPITVGVVTKGAANTIKPNAPRIDTKLGKVLFSVGESILSGMVVAKAQSYVDEAIDEVFQNLQGVVEEEVIEEGETGFESDDSASSIEEVFESGWNDSVLTMTVHIHNSAKEQGMYIPPSGARELRDAIVEWLADHDDDTHAPLTPKSYFTQQMVVKYGKDRTKESPSNE